MTGKILEQFMSEVISQPSATAVLPQNLSDQWLGLLLEETESLVPYDPESQVGAGLWACIMKIHAHQIGSEFFAGGEEPIEILYSQFSKYLKFYTLCLAMEEINRKSDIRAEVPTLDNIFDEERVVKFAR